MSYASNDFQGGGSGGNAEPSMEEILASIRRILKEDEPGKPAAPGAAAAAPAPAPPETQKPAAFSPPPLDIDDDVLLLDASMITRPADYAAVIPLPASSVTPPGPPPAFPSGPEPLHFSSEPAPFSRDFDLSPRAMPEPVVELPDAEPEPEPEPEPAAYAPTAFAATQYTAPPEPAPAPEILAEPEPAAYRPLQPPSTTPPPEAEAPPLPAFLAPSAFHPEPEPEPEAFFVPPPIPAEPPAAPIIEPEPYHPEPIPAATFNPAPAPIAATPITPEKFPTEPDMNDAPLPDSFEPPEGLISDKTTDAAASSIGALVRSMTIEKSVAITKTSSVTIEDIVREEIRPLLKAWLDTHLPTLVERVVRSEIERVISRSVV